MLSMGIISGLLLIPHAIELGYHFGDPEFDRDSTHLVKYNDEFGEQFAEGLKYKWALFITIIGIILLDFNADICQSPARAYILDMSIAEDHSKGMSAFGIMCGVGSFLGFLICSIDWTTWQLGDLLGGNIPTVFTLCTICLIICMITTVTSFREIPLPLMEADELLRPVTQSAVRQEYEKRKANLGNLEALKQQLNDSNNNNDSLVAVEAADAEIDVDSDSEVEERVTLIQYLKSVVVMPKSLRILCLTHLFTKMALLSYSLYFTDFVGEVIFEGDPKGHVDSHELLLYEEGVRFGCWGLASFALSCTMYSFVIDKIIKFVG